MVSACGEFRTTNDLIDRQVYITYQDYHDVVAEHFGMTKLDITIVKTWSLDL
jgi:hypothetical protein